MKATITFQSLTQDSQNYATFEKNDAHMVSIIHFDLVVGNDDFKGLSVELLQPYGTDFESEPFEVGRVQGYNGPWNHVGFSDLCTAYVRSLIGSSGRGIHIQGGGNIRMRNNRFVFSQTAVLEIPDDRGGAW